MLSGKSSKPMISLTNLRFGDEIVAALHDEDSADIELNVVALLLGPEEIEGCTHGNEEDKLELEMAFNGEVLDSGDGLPSRCGRRGI
jgi:hypothetical protein